MQGAAQQLDSGARSMRGRITRYLAEVSTLVSRIDASQIERVADLIFEAYRRGCMVFIFGNGGGSSTASHLACDLAKGTAAPGRRRLRALSLSDNVPLLTAWANDTDYTNTFGEQLANFVGQGDVVIGLSGRGYSPNVVSALDLANQRGAISILFSGFDGGKAKFVAQESIIVPSDNMQQVEDAHMILGHILFTCLRERILEEGNPA